VHVVAAGWSRVSVIEPATHAMQLAMPALLYSPAMQSAQATVGSLLTCPASQAVQQSWSVAPVTLAPSASATQPPEHVNASQVACTGSGSGSEASSVQLVAPSASKVSVLEPTAQTAQAAVEAELYCPTAQNVHVAAPV